MRAAVGFEVGDSLYVYKEKFIYVASKTLPLPGHDEPDLKNLLELVRVIMNKTTSISETKNGEKPTKTKQMTHTWSRGGVMQRYASSIGRQIALLDEKIDHSDKTWKILESNTDNIPLKTKAILALVAFATMYGKLRLVALVSDSNQLAKSITLLKHQPDIQMMKDQSEKWFESLSKIIGLALDLADSLMDLEEPQALPNSPENVREQMALLSTTVHKIVHIVLICWSQVVAILINHSRQDKTSYLLVFDQWERNLRDKNLEIEGKLAKKDGASTAVSVDERPQTPRLSQPTSASCWQKLCQIVTLTYCRIGKGDKA